METTLKGNAWVYGDNVDTDVIIPARYLVTSDERSLAAHCMEDIDLPILECTETDRIAKGDLIEIDLTKGTITNRTKGETYHAKPFPEFLQSLIGLGGLVPYVRTRLSEQGR